MAEAKVTLEAVSAPVESVTLALSEGEARYVLALLGYGYGYFGASSSGQYFDVYEVLKDALEEAGVPESVIEDDMENIRVFGNDFEPS